MIQRFVAEGERFPTGYGMAWLSWDRAGCVAYPIPLNWIFGWLRRAYITLVHGPSPAKWDIERREWFTKGYNKCHSETEELRRGIIRSTAQSILTEVCVVLSGRGDRAK